MALTLSANVNSTTETFPVVDDGLSLDRGQWFQVDDELVEFVNYGQVNVTRADWRQDRSRLLVKRHMAGTTAASHTSGKTLTPYYPDAPGAGGAGGSFPDAWTVDPDTGALVITDIGTEFGDPENPNTIFSVMEGDPVENWTFIRRAHVYSRLFLDDAPMVATNDNGGTVFEITTDANGGDGSVQVAGTDITSIGDVIDSYRINDDTYATTGIAVNPGQGVLVRLPGAEGFVVADGRADLGETIFAVHRDDDAGSTLMEFTSPAGNAFQVVYSHGGDNAISFFGGGGSAQGVAIPDATDEASAVSGLNALLAYLRQRGDIAE